MLTESREESEGSLILTSRGRESERGGEGGGLKDVSSSRGNPARVRGREVEQGMEQGGTKMVEPNWNRKREGGERGSDREKRSSAGGSQIRKGLYKGEKEDRGEGEDFL